MPRKEVNLCKRSPSMREHFQAQFKTKKVLEAQSKRTHFEDFSLGVKLV
jgi:hypothetical protein